VNDVEDDELIDDSPPLGHRYGGWRWVGLALGAVMLLLVGAVAGVMWSQRRSGVERLAKPAPSASQAPSPAALPTGGSSDDPVEVSLTPEAVQRAGIKVARATSGISASGINVPGTVTSNAYQDTKVTALVGGIVRQVSVELGAPVQHGQTLAVIFSSDLSDAQMKYLSMRAMLEADHLKLQRTEQLYGVGAASRQELEEVTALHTSHETELAAAQQRLLLLGLTRERVQSLTNASHVVSELMVPSPAEGLVVSRSVNPGQVVNAGQELFVVTDLSTVWVIGDLYEKDFSAVHVGSEATVTVPSTPERTVRGRVAYIDPRVDPASRTAKVRVEVPNRGDDLRLGMFVTVSFRGGSSDRITFIPRVAVQTIGERAVVYVPAEGEDGKFVERQVKLGASSGDFVQVLDGVKPGDKVVTDGSFFLRAEAARTRSGS
jgi:cobalt-zinc-cadmium efflux system membrane fusion protein